jgi:hypothetical protein
LAESPRTDRAGAVVASALWPLFTEARRRIILRSTHRPSPTQQALRRVYSCLMPNENSVLKETIKHLEEASRRIQASRHLMQENALVEDSNYLRLVARLSEALDVTEAARRETRRLRDAG